MLGAVRPTSTALVQVQRISTQSSIASSFALYSLVFVERQEGRCRFQSQPQACKLILRSFDSPVLCPFRSKLQVARSAGAMMPVWFTVCRAVREEHG